MIPIYGCSTRTKSANHAAYASANLDIRAARGFEASRLQDEAESKAS